MLKPYDPADDVEPVPPECRATVARIQSVLDGDSPAESLDADTDLHPTACPTCRERVRAARVLLSVLAAPSEPVAVPSNFTDGVLTAVRADRRARKQRRVLAAVGGLAVAAAVLIAVGLVNRNPESPAPVEVVNQPTPAPNIAPAPHPKPEPAPEPHPIRVGEALAHVEQSLREVPKPIADTAAVTPKLFAALTDPFTRPAPMADPMGAGLQPARAALAELPGAARSGITPVTGTAQKAFDRFLRDVGAVTTTPDS